VADLIKEIALLGPRDSLLRSLSLVSMRFKLFRGFAGTGRFVAAPGREAEPEKLADFDSLGFGGETTTGPPNLRFMTAQRSGRRAEKLKLVRKADLK